MTSIHARIPPELEEAAQEARHRGDDMERRDNIEARPSMIRKPASTSGVMMKKPPHLTIAQADSSSRSISAPVLRPQNTEDESSDNEIENDENDPSLSPSPVIIPTTSPRRPSSKRPLSDLPTPVEPESDNDDDQAQHLSPSEKNIAANALFFPPSTSTSSTPSEQQESFKLTERRRSVNFSNPRSQQQQDNNTPIIRPFQDTEDVDDADRPKKRVCSGEGKENFGETSAPALPSTAEPSRAAPLSSNVMPPKPVVGAAAPRKVAAAAKAKARVGLRRL